MSTKTTTGARKEKRVTVRLDRETEDAMKTLVEEAPQKKNGRCQIIRDALKVGLKLRSHILIVRLGVLSHEELKLLGSHAESLSNCCNSLANALRDMRSLDAYHEVVAAEWSDALRDCREATKMADQLATEIATIVRLRAEPPPAAIAAIQTRVKKLKRLEAEEVDTAKQASYASQMSALQDYLQSVWSLEDKPRTGS